MNVTLSSVKVKEIFLGGTYYGDQHPLSAGMHLQALESKTDKLSPEGQGPTSPLKLSLGGQDPTSSLKLSLGGQGPIPCEAAHGSPLGCFTESIRSRQQVQTPKHSRSKSTDKIFRFNSAYTFCGPVG